MLVVGGNKIREIILLAKLKGAELKGFRLELLEYYLNNRNNGVEQIILCLLLSL